jgi:hypothetical protein
MPLEVRKVSPTVHLEGSRADPNSIFKVFVTRARLLRTQFRQSSSPYRHRKKWEVDLPRLPEFHCHSHRDRGKATTVKAAQGQGR